MSQWAYAVYEAAGVSPLYSQTHPILNMMQGFNKEHVQPSALHADPHGTPRVTTSLPSPSDPGNHPQIMVPLLCPLWRVAGGAGTPDPLPMWSRPSPLGLLSPPSSLSIPSSLLSGLSPWPSREPRASSVVRWPRALQLSHASCLISSANSPGSIKTSVCRLGALPTAGDLI